jgi:hypothetical protein
VRKVRSSIAPTAFGALVDIMHFVQAMPFAAWQLHRLIVFAWSRDMYTTMKIHTSNDA